MDVSLRQVEVFAAVAHALHFGKAAEALYTSQSMVSQEIRRLEDRAGALLFDRSTRRVALTPAGEALLPAAEALLAASREFAIAARLAAGLDTTLLRLAASPSAMNDLVPRALRRSEEALPHLTIEDIAVETGEVEPALLAGDADVGIGRFLDLPAGYRVETVREEEVLVAMSAAHPAAASRHVRLDRLSELPLMLWPRERSPRYYDVILDICHRRGLDPIVLVSQPRIIGSRSYFLSENRAFTLISASAASALPLDIAVRPLAEPATLPLEVGWRAADPRPAVARLVEVIRSVG